MIYTICHPHGTVLRIVIFKKNGVQAMVEFDSIESATRARDNLNGCDIYSSCCTLKIDYAKVSVDSQCCPCSFSCMDPLISIKKIDKFSPLVVFAR